MSETQAPETDELRHRIHEAAIGVFTESGREGAQIADIIQRANVTKDDFDARFSGTEEILREQALFFARAFGELIPERKPADRTVHGTMQSAMRDVAASITSYDKHYMRVIWTSNLFFEPDGPIKEAFERVYERWEHLFTDGQTAGEIHASRDPRQLTEMLMGIVYVTIVNWLIDWWDDPGNLQLRLARASDQFLHGAATH